MSDLIRHPQGRAFDQVVGVDSDSPWREYHQCGGDTPRLRKEGIAPLARAGGAILEALEVPPLDAPSDAECGGIRSELEAAGRMIGPNDLLISVHAYA